MRRRKYSTVSLGGGPLGSVFFVSLLESIVRSGGTRALFNFKVQGGISQEILRSGLP
jgi:hypothetical protein